MSGRLCLDHLPVRVIEDIALVKVAGGPCAISLITIGRERISQAVTKIASRG